MVLVGCVEAPEVQAPRVVETNVDGPGPFDPTGTVTVRLSARVDTASAEGVALVRGEPSAALLDAIDRPPLPARARTALVAVRTVVAASTVRLTPRRALAPSSRYTLVVGSRVQVGGRVLGKPTLRAFTTASLDEAAPILELLDPPDGAAGVVRNLRQVHARVSHVIEPLGATLVDDEDQPVAASVAPDDCDSCLQLTLSEPLAARRHYRLIADPMAVDAAGRVVFGDPPGFDSSDELRAGPTVLEAPSVEAADGCVVARFGTDVATTGRLCVGDACTTDGPTRVHELALPVPAGEAAAQLSAWDETTLPPATAGITVSVSSVPLRITEVLTDPLGPRLANQFVELWNFGAAPVELSGLVLSDPEGQDALPPLTVGPGAYALVVPDGYAPDGVDPSPSPGAVIAPISDGRLGGRGLRVAGEPVWIEDAAGHPITRWGGYPLMLARGQSVTRVGTCDVPSSFRATPSGGATPGGP
jgi:hypothetical protein